MTVAFAAALLTSGLWFAACQKDKNPATPAGGNSSSALSSPNARLSSTGSNSMIFPLQAHMYGKTYAEWSAAWWKWDLQFDCAHFPSTDIDGTRENQNQSGPVFFLAGRRGHTLSV